MKEKILNEIYDTCEECRNHEHCPENDCVLYRIEQIAQNNKKTYKVEITETLQKVIAIEAESETEAIFKINEQYNDEKIVLDSSDFVDYDIKTIGGN